MQPVTKTDIKKALRDLGLSDGDIVIVHSSLSSFGEVEGGAAAVVDALLEVIGPEGTLMAPTQSARRPYDYREDPSTMGAVSEEIRTRPNAVRSMSPCMPPAAIGPQAEEFVKDHHRLECPLIGGPYHLAAEAGGYVLLLGVDQDRNTTLHIAEALVRAPYLNPVEAEYVDENGRVRTYRGELYAGPHRDFIGIDKRLQQAGILKKTVIGKCVARLMRAKDMIEFCVGEIKKHPALFIADNDGYEDGIAQRGDIRAAQIESEESFRLIARASSAGRNTEEVLWHARRAGVSAIEADVLDGRDITQLEPDDLLYVRRRLETRGIGVDVIRPGVFTDAGFRASLKAATALGAHTVVWPMTGTVAQLQAKARAAREANAQLLLENVAIASEAVNEVMDAVGRDAGLAFNPARFAGSGELPFLNSFHKLKRHVRYVAMTDASQGGTPCYIGQGYGEVKEIVSILRCRSFEGFFCLGDSPDALRSLDFGRMADTFYDALEHC